MSMCLHRPVPSIIIDLSGLTVARPGQLEVNPGVVIMGYKGDPIFDNPKKPQRPSWTKDGSVMVFRKLEQLVESFNNYVDKYGPYWKNFTPIPDQFPKHDDEAAFGKEYFAATMIGRWKSVCDKPLKITYPNLTTS
jgi:hypothetical protein